MRALVVLIVVLTGAVPGAAPSAAADVSDQDRRYASNVHQLDIFESVAGNLAQGKGTCPPVRELGPRFGGEHLGLDTELLAVSARLGIVLDGSPDPATAGRLGDLAARTGRDFDAAWLRHQVAVHDQALAQAARELRYGWSEEIKGLAAAAEPMLRTHRDEAGAAQAAC